MFLECDYDGKFLIVDDSFKKTFNYLDDTFISSNRVFNLIHPDSVLYFIDFYNSFLNSAQRKVEKTFIFYGYNYSSVICTITLEKFESKIRFTFLKINNTSLMKKSFYSNIKEFLFLTRAKFVIGSLMPFFFSVPWCYYRHGNFSIFLSFLLFLSLIFLHMSANTFNDYFDWRSGRDKANLDYVFSSTGGSRAIDLKIISEKNMLYVSLILFFLVFIISLYFIYLRGFNILIFGLIAVFSIYFYSAPPIHLASRRGLGELMHIVCLGPIIILGSIYVFVGSIDYASFFIGIPHGLLITACLLVNEFPDSNFDKLSGKNNLAVVFGYRYIAYIYSFLIFLSFLFSLVSILFFSLSYLFLFSFSLVPYAIYICYLVFKISFTNREIISAACIKSLNIYIYYSIIVTLSCLLAIYFNP